MACAGVLVFIGFVPNTNFLPSEIERDDTGVVRTGENGATSVPALWAIGVARRCFRSVLDGAKRDAERVLATIA